MTLRYALIRSTLLVCCCCALPVAADPSAASRADPISRRRDDPSTATSKPWVEDFAAFVNSSGGGRWIVGRSTSPCLSEDEAFRAASRDARDQLMARLGPQAPLPRDAEGDVWLQRRVAQELAAGRLVTDRYVSRVRRPYGELWSESILVDASGERLSALAREHATWLRNRYHTRRGALAGVAGLSLAILLVYAAVNAATKGYFRGRLRAGAVLSLALGLFAVIYTTRGTG
jgi:hypothetical protein